MQIGIDSFAALVPDPITGHTVTAQERITQLLQEIELADKVGLDSFGLGEHHRVEYLDSAPPFANPPTSTGPASTAPHSQDKASTRARCKPRSPSGSELAARRNPSSAPAHLACRSWSPSSAANPTASVPSSTSTAKPASA